MDEKYTPIECCSTQDLEQLLRREGETMPAEELLPLLDELARRKPATADPAAAWQQLQSEYLFREEAPRKRFSWRRGLAVAAAAAVLVAGLVVSVGAIGGRNLWKLVLNKTKDTLVLSGVEPTAPEDEPEAYDTFHDEVYADTGIGGLAPSYIPEGYELAEFERRQEFEKTVYFARYIRGEQYLRVQVQTWLPDDVVHIEKDDTPIEVYSEMEVDCYITRNLDRMTATWVKGGYQCIISGDVTHDELIKMLDSVS